MFYVKMFLLMLLLHLFADFTLQGWFANGKQRSWWVDQCKQFGVWFDEYKHDYLCALVGHAFYWALVTFAPLIFFMEWPSCVYLVIFLGFQVWVHACVDHQKANKFRINLIQDQLCHVCQIVLGLAFYYMVV